LLGWRLEIGQLLLAVPNTLENATRHHRVATGRLCDGPTGCAAGIRPLLEREDVPHPAGRFGA
jgi:hypothetical protein